MIEEGKEREAREARRRRRTRKLTSIKGILLLNLSVQYTLEQMHTKAQIHTSPLLEAWPLLADLAPWYSNALPLADLIGQWRLIYLDAAPAVSIRSMCACVCTHPSVYTCTHKHMFYLIPVKLALSKPALPLPQQLAHTGSSLGNDRGGFFCRRRMEWGEWVSTHSPRPILLLQTNPGWKKRRETVIKNRKGEK